MVSKYLLRSKECVLVIVFICVAALENCHAVGIKGPHPPPRMWHDPASLADAITLSRSSDSSARASAARYLADNPSPASVGLIARLAGDPDAAVSNDATEDLENFVTGWGGSIHYTAGQLGKYGGAAMAKSLMVRLHREADDVQTLRLLSCVAARPEVRRFLVKLRSQPGVVYVEEGRGGESMHVSVAFAADFALAQGGDGLAVRRLQATLRQGRFEDRVFLLRSFWCVRDRETLLTMLDFAQDARVVPGEGPLCDWALDKMICYLMPHDFDIDGVKVVLSEDLDPQQKRRLVQRIRDYIRKLPASRP